MKKTKSFHAKIGLIAMILNLFLGSLLINPAITLADDICTLQGNIYTDNPPYNNLVGAEDNLAGGGIVLKLTDANGNPNGSNNGTGTTDANGHYTIENISQNTELNLDIDNSTLPPAFAVFTGNGHQTVNCADLGVQAQNIGINLDSVPLPPPPNNDCTLNGSVIIDDQLPYGHVTAADNKGKSGVTINITDPNNGNAIIASTATDADGKYTFEHLPASFDASVDILTLGNYFVTTPVNTLNQNFFCQVSPQNALAVGINIGKVNGVIFYDSEQPGDPNYGKLFNPPDSGLNGATIQLLDNQNQVVASTKSFGGGFYTFNNIPLGFYTAKVDEAQSVTDNALQASYVLTTNNSPSSQFEIKNNSTESNVAPIGYTWDANLGKGSVTGNIFFDSEAVGDPNYGKLNGPPDIGLNNITVQLLDNQNQVVASTKTAGGGFYQFNDILAGSYKTKVDEVQSVTDSAIQSPYTLTTNNNPTNSFVVIGNNPTNADPIGYTWNQAIGKGTVTGSIFYDSEAPGNINYGKFNAPPDSGLNNVTVQLLDNQNQVVASTKTAGGGFYQFNNVLAGSHKTQVDEAQSIIDGALQPNPDLTTNNPTIQFIVVANNTTNADPIGYNWGLGNGNGKVSGSVFYDSEVAGDPNYGKFNAPFDLGLNNITVHLLNNQNQIIKTVKTANGGFYNFDNIIAGSYTIQIDEAQSLADSALQSPYTITTNNNPSNSFLVVQNNNTFVGTTGYTWDLSNTRGTGLVNGKVFFDSELPGDPNYGKYTTPPDLALNNVTVQLIDNQNQVVASTKTFGEGFYQFNDVNPGKYKTQVNFQQSVTDEALAGTAVLTTNNSPTSLFLVVQNNSTFAGSTGYTWKTTVTGYIFQDNNKNGVQDPGEGNLQGIKVIITENGVNPQILITDSNGGYSTTIFTGFPGPGTINVDVDQQNSPIIPTWSITTVALGGTDPQDFKAVMGNDNQPKKIGYVPPQNPAPDNRNNNGSGGSGDRSSGSGCASCGFGRDASDNKSDIPVVTNKDTNQNNSTNSNNEPYFGGGGFGDQNNQEGGGAGGGSGAALTGDNEKLLPATGTSIDLIGNFDRISMMALGLSILGSLAIYELQRRKRI